MDNLQFEAHQANIRALIIELHTLEGTMACKPYDGTTLGK